MKYEYTTEVLCEIQCVFKFKATSWTHLARRINQQEKRCLNLELGQLPEHQRRFVMRYVWTSGCMCLLDKWVHVHVGQCAQCRSLPKARGGILGVRLGRKKKRRINKGWRRTTLNSSRAKWSTTCNMSRFSFVGGEGEGSCPYSAAQCLFPLEPLIYAFSWSFTSFMVAPQSRGSLSPTLFFRAVEVTLDIFLLWESQPHPQLFLSTFKRAFLCENESLDRPMIFLP